MRAKVNVRSMPKRTITRIIFVVRIMEMTRSVQSLLVTTLTGNTTAIGR